MWQSGDLNWVFWCPKWYISIYPLGGFSRKSVEDEISKDGCSPGRLLGGGGKAGWVYNFARLRTKRTYQVR